MPGASCLFAAFAAGGLPHTLQLDVLSAHTKDGTTRQKRIAIEALMIRANEGSETLPTYLPNIPTYVPTYVPAYYLPTAYVRTYLPTYVLEAAL